MISPRGRQQSKSIKRTRPRNEVHGTGCTSPQVSSVPLGNNNQQLTAAQGKAEQHEKEHFLTWLDIRFCITESSSDFYRY